MQNNISKERLAVLLHLEHYQLASLVIRVMRDAHPVFILSSPSSPESTQSHNRLHNPRQFHAHPISDSAPTFPPEHWATYWRTSKCCVTYLLTYNRNSLTLLTLFTFPILLTFFISSTFFQTSICQSEGS